jgi:hypothetical protein
LHPNLTDHIWCPGNTVSDVKRDAVFFEQHEFCQIGFEGITD